MSLLIDSIVFRYQKRERWRLLPDSMSSYQGSFFLRVLGRSARTRSKTSRNSNLSNGLLRYAATPKFLASGRVPKFTGRSENHDPRVG